MLFSPPHRETDWSSIVVSINPTVSNVDRFCGQNLYKQCLETGSSRSRLRPWTLLGDFHPPDSLDYTATAFSPTQKIKIPGFTTDVVPRQSNAQCHCPRGLPLLVITAVTGSTSQPAYIYLNSLLSKHISGFTTLGSSVIINALLQVPRAEKKKLRAGYRAPSLQRTSYVVMRFHRRVWYRALFLHYACIRSSGIILIP